MNIKKKQKIIQKFASNIIENLENINPKYAKLVNKNFWKLISYKSEIKK